eukprot:Gregarina_sp_Poly_1__7776@NODE_43_length_18077_cov_117_559078_g37_i0_p14_GENE_NODE_43_length_18077_cov_117_559078_g37_i0NODE_43_length_18077_cov_117_559078_g37_i0_p14_ORF_typecomplete_len168_score12_34CHORD/PF04968_12/0_076CHORD/PF04968_12/2_5e02_NODE_43_length_18077_cov_117_559078_g37_i01757318049
MPNATCRVCKEPYNAAKNHNKACRFHPLLFRGAEAGWYLDLLTKEVNYSGTSKLMLLQKWEEDDVCKKMEAVAISLPNDVEMSDDIEMKEAFAPTNRNIPSMHDIGQTKEALKRGHGTVYFWECCGSYDVNAPVSHSKICTIISFKGCKTGKHKSYDE